MADEGLLGLGEYTGRESAPISQTAESTISTSPPPQTPAPPVSPPPAAAPAPPEPVRPEETKADFIGDLSKAFATQIGETPAPAAQSPAPVQPPPEKTWRDAEAPPTVTKKVAEDWRTFRDKAKADIELREGRIKALEQQLEESKKVVPTYESQISEERKRGQDAMALLERVAIERSPLFKSKVLDQEALVAARLGQLIEGTGVTAQEAHYLLHGDLRTRENIVESRQISTFRRQQIVDALARWDNVQEERSKMLERGKETLQQYVKEQQDAQEGARAQFLREAEKTFEDQMALITQKVEVLRPIEGNEAWNKDVDAMKHVARQIYSGSVPRELVAQAAILAPAAIKMHGLIHKLWTENQDLRAQVGKLRGVQPEIRDTGGDIAQPGQVLSSPNGDFVKNLVDRFKRDTGLQ